MVVEIKEGKIFISGESLEDSYADVIAQANDILTAQEFCKKYNGQVLNLDPETFIVKPDNSLKAKLAKMAEKAKEPKCADSFEKERQLDREIIAAIEAESPSMEEQIGSQEIPTVALEEPQKPDEIKVQELEEEVRKCFELKKEHNEAKVIASAIDKKLDEQQDKVMTMLEGLGMTKYVSQYGTFSWKLDQSFLVPKDDESRAKFFEYLKERQVFDTLITVNSATLNAFATQEEELANANGVFDFQIPGILRGEPVRKAKQTPAKPIEEKKKK